MAVDYLSAINQGGSGLNITQIVEGIVEAETAPQKDIVNKKIDNKTLEISALGEVAKELNLLKKHPCFLRMYLRHYLKLYFVRRLLIH